MSESEFLVFTALVDMLLFGFYWESVFTFQKLIKIMLLKIFLSVYRAWWWKRSKTHFLWLCIEKNCSELNQEESMAGFITSSLNPFITGRILKFDYFYNVFNCFSFFLICFHFINGKAISNLTVFHSGCTPKLAMGLFKNRHA